MPVSEDVEVTELLVIDPDRVDAVESPANGTAWLMFKALDDEGTPASTEDVLAEINAPTKAELDAIVKADMEKIGREACDSCEGLAKAADGEPCSKCFGTGILPRPGDTPDTLIALATKGHSAPSGAPVPVRKDCPTCKGTGYLPFEKTDKKCPDCDGSGHDSTEPPADALARVDGDGHHIHEGDAKGREKVDKSVEDGLDGESIAKNLYLDDDDSIQKAKLKAKQRNALPDSAFALPGRRYPIHDESHARNALSRVSQYGTSEEQSKVRAAVHRRYPNIGREATASKSSDGTTYTAPNPTLAAMAQKVGSSGDEADPGSPAWEAVDAQIACDAATALMAAADCIRQFKQREEVEVAAGEGNDVFDAFDACQALCAVTDALGIMARLAFHEGLEAAKSLDDTDDVEKAGKRLSRQTVTALIGVRDHITKLLGQDDPGTTDDEATKSVEIEMHALTNEIEDMQFDELTKLLGENNEQLVAAFTEALKALDPTQDVHHGQSIPKAKAANSKAKKKDPKAENSDLEDEANQGTNDSASSPAKGAAKSDGDEVTFEVTDEVTETYEVE